MAAGVKQTLRSVFTAAGERTRRAREAVADVGEELVERRREKKKQKKVAHVAGVRAGMEKVAAGVAAPSGTTGEDPLSSGETEPLPDAYVRHTRHPTKPERRLVRPRGKLTKKAENVSQTVDSSDVGTKAQTAGEKGMHESATGLGQTIYSGLNTKSKNRAERGPGNQKSGVPIWITLTKNLASPAARGGGDKVGPQRTDKQFHIPVKDSRPV